MLVSTHYCLNITFLLVLMFKYARNTFRIPHEVNSKELDYGGRLQSCLILLLLELSAEKKMQFFHVTMLYFLNSIHVFVTISMYFVAIVLKLSYTIKQRK